MIEDLLKRMESAERGRPIRLTAEELNALARFLAECRLLDLPTPSVISHHAAEHHWETTVRRLESDPAQWAVSIGPGLINDELAAIPYRREGDPRGWTPPPGYAAPQPGEPQYSAAIIERDLLDDLDDPPWLLAFAPRDFDLVPRAQWPPHFAFAADDDLAGADLWRSHVLLSVKAIAPPFLADITAPLFARPRLYLAAQLPSLNYAASAGGWVEIATLYLVRAASGNPEEDQLIVQQQEFWSLWNMLIQPGQNLLAEVDVAGSIATPSFGGLGLGFADSFAQQQAAANAALVAATRGALEQTLFQSEWVEYWTV
jgi:hypothetical protein